MKSKNILPVYLLLSLLIISVATNAQEGHWVFKEIIMGNHSGSTNLPDKIEIDVNEGFVEFSLPQSNDCTDRYRFTYRFLQDMNTLEVPEDRNYLPIYQYEIEFELLDSPCTQNYSNPYVRVSHWNMTSGLLGNMKKDKTWNYKYHQEYINNYEGSARNYAYNPKTVKSNGKIIGEYKITGPYKKDVDRTISNYTGIATDFRILFNGQSTNSKADCFYYDILFVYELKKGTPDTTQNPCDINQPDCSCCPGTIPVWNFQSNKGDCICPEGQVWDKINNKCMKAN